MYESLVRKHDQLQNEFERKRAFRYARAALRAAMAEGNVERQMHSEFRIAKAHYYLNSFARAAEHSRVGIQIGEGLLARSELSEGDQVLLANQRVLLAVRLAMMGVNAEDSDKQMKAAVSFFDLYEDLAARVSSRGMWAEIRMFQQRWNESARYSDEALHLAGYPSSSTGTAYALWVGGRCLCRLDNCERALKMTEHAEALCAEIGDPSGLVEALFSSAEALYGLNRWAECLARVQRAGEIAAVTRSGVVCAWARVHQGRFLAATGGRKQVARGVILRAITHLREAGVNALVNEAQQVLAAL